MSRTSCLFVLLHCCFSLHIFCQISFQTQELGKIFNSGTTLSTSDVNGDFIPDLLIIHQSTELWLGINSGTNEFYWNQIDNELDGNPWSVNVVDINQDKTNDIILSGESYGVVLYKQDKEGNFGKEFIDETPYYSQAASLIDLDKNSFPDLFVCGEFEESRLYLNVNGELKRDTNKIDLTFNEKDSDYGNYGCVWSDIDNDSDMDLYISRCRPDVADPNDRRRRNLFFQNNNGIFSEVADAKNISVLDQTWVSEIGDLDNDGLQDIVVLNHYTPSLIFKQKTDHTFDDVTPASGFAYNGNGMQVIMKDFDNDMDLDFIIVGEKSEIWLNQRSMRFVKSKTEFISTPINSCAIADFNQDGSQDILASFGDFINYPNEIRNRIFIGIPNQNNYIVFNLIGEESNYNAIGARVKIYTNGKIQMRELRSGESFGIQNSYQVHFGLGSNSKVDSAIIHWPNGKVSTIINSSANQFYTITESGCGVVNLLLNFEGKKVLCNGDSQELKPVKKYADFEWNTGELTNIITVSQSGVYYCKALDEQRCLVISKPIYIEIDPKENPKLSNSGEVILCSDEILTIRIESYNAIKWNNNSTSDQLTIKGSGMYYGTVQGQCREFVSDTLNVIRVSQLVPPLVRDTTILGSASLLLKADSDLTNWFNKETDVIPIFTGQQYQTPLLLSTTEFWLERFSNNEYAKVNAGLVTPEYSSIQFHVQTLNGGMYFRVTEDCTLDSVTLYTDRTGLRRIILKDSLGIAIDSQDVDLVIGKNNVKIDFELFRNIGTYYLTTAEHLNRKNFLNKSPWLFRSDKGFQYPIENSDIITFLHSAIGEAEYHYFYDWKIKRNVKKCRSARIPVKVTIRNTDVSNSNSETNRIQIAPNKIILNNPQSIRKITLFNLSGKEVWNYSHPPELISTYELLPGFYLIKLFLANGTSITHKAILGK
ncbi:MAG: CRTAC1 family protein [Saprospiraceae bacterium]|nr:CRTAC1 family protein [Saprospiraceae bacterium]